MSLPLSKVPMTKRIGCTVIAPDGLPALFWGVTERRKYGDFAGSQVFLGIVREAHLWRGGALLDPISEAESRRLPVAALHRVHEQDRNCARKGHPTAAPEAAECPDCGASILPLPGGSDTTEESK